MAKYYATMPNVAYKIVGNIQHKDIASKPLIACKESRALSGDIEKIIHDFRSSLNVIIGYSELMLDNAMGKINSQQRDGLRDILSSSESLIDLVNDIVVWQNDYKDTGK